MHGSRRGSRTKTEKPSNSAVSGCRILVAVRLIRASPSCWGAATRPSISHCQPRWTQNVVRFFSAPYLRIMEQDTAKALVTTGLTHPTVAALYASVDARSPITIVPSTDRFWGSSTDGAGTRISVAKTAYAAESLYHELLHADLKLNGYRQHLTYVRIDDDTTVQILAEALDNELQHHRMFAAFVAAGFDPVRFYHDGDTQTFDGVRAKVKRLTARGAGPASYFLAYLSVIAPGGAGSDAKRQQLDRFFRMTAPKTIMVTVDAAAAKVLAWGVSSQRDPGPTIIDIIQSFGVFDGWWVGASTRFPSDGHFVGAPFTFTDAQRYAASQR